MGPWTTIALYSLALSASRVCARPLSDTEPLAVRSPEDLSVWYEQNTLGADKYLFSPYWVPFGSTPVDDTDSRIVYAPDKYWLAVEAKDSIGGTAHIATHPSASAIFTFEGTGVEWFGSISPKHGSAQVWLDGELIKTVNLSSQTNQVHQLLYNVAHLPDTRHIIKIISGTTRSSFTNDDFFDIDAFVVQSGGYFMGHPNKPRMERKKRQTGAWTLAQTGSTGVSAMQIAVVDDTQVIIIDKVEHNLISVAGHPAWMAVYDLDANDVRALNPLTNSFCAGGSFLSNGTLINVGGNPVVAGNIFDDTNGLQGIRLFTPCPDGDCDIYENPSRIRMASSRWYASVARLPDGSALIIGGSIEGEYQDAA